MSQEISFTELSIGFKGLDRSVSLEGYGIETVFNSLINKAKEKMDEKYKPYFEHEHKLEELGKEVSNHFKELERGDAAAKEQAKEFETRLKALFEQKYLSIFDGGLKTGSANEVTKEVLYVISTAKLKEDMIKGFFDKALAKISLISGGKATSAMIRNVLPETRNTIPPELNAIALKQHVNEIRQQTNVLMNDRPAVTNDIVGTAGGRCVGVVKNVIKKMPEIKTNTTTMEIVKQSMTQLFNLRKELHKHDDEDEQFFDVKRAVNLINEIGTVIMTVLSAQIFVQNRAENFVKHYIDMCNHFLKK